VRAAGQLRSEDLEDEAIHAAVQYTASPFARETVAGPGMKQARANTGHPWRPNRVTMGRRAAFDIDDVQGKTEFAATTASGTATKASLILDTVKMGQLQPARSALDETAGTGPEPNIPGSTRAQTHRTQTGIGLKP